MQQALARTRRGLSACALAALCGVAPGAGCGGHTSSLSPVDDACGQYYDAVFADCVRSVPDSELNRVRSRFMTACRDLLAVPGEGVDAAALKACAGGVAAVGGCASAVGVVNECAFSRGSLPSGSACQDSGQCSGGACQRAAMQVDGGAIQPSCGVCQGGSPASVGQPCPVGTAGCVDGAACTAATPSTCQPIVFGNVGAACDFETSRCKTGLLCNSSTLACVALGGTGAACGSTAECAKGLVCRVAVPGGASSPATFLCQPPAQNGEPCSSSNDCGRNLACASATGRCASLSWAEAGQPCGELTPCLVGVCSATQGVCPEVLADGQPCASAVGATCDAFSECLDGVCTLQGTPSCH